MIILMTKALRADAYDRLLARRTDGTPEEMAKEDARLGGLAAPLAEQSEDWRGWHGHVRPRPDGVRMRCGGIAMCSGCQAESATLVKARAAPTPAQAEAGNYRKRPVAWQGLTIKVENEAGSVRRGKDRDGKAWETKMPYAYGYVARSEGVDGDEVDVYLGPELESAATVYVVHQRKKGAPGAAEWKGYDEDKVMLGFADEAAAREAYLKCYDDPRFLGPITAMPVAEFVEKAKATKERPAMIKSMPVLILFAKAHVGPYMRGGRLVNLVGYQGKNARARVMVGQASLFAEPDEATGDLFAEQPADRLIDADEHGEVPPGRPAYRDADTAHAEGDQWVMPIKDAIAEHRELVAALESPGMADDREEIEEQGGELARMESAAEQPGEAAPSVLIFAQKREGAIDQKDLTAASVRSKIETSGAIPGTARRESGAQEKTMSGMSKQDCLESAEKARAARADALSRATIYTSAFGGSSDMAQAAQAEATKAWEAASYWERLAGWNPQSRAKAFREQSLPSFIFLYSVVQ